MTTNPADGVSFDPSSKAYFDPSSQTLRIEIEEDQENIDILALKVIDVVNDRLDKFSNESPKVVKISIINKGKVLEIDCPDAHLIDSVIASIKAAKEKEAKNLIAKATENRELEEKETSSEASTCTYLKNKSQISKDNPAGDRFRLTLVIQLNEGDNLEASASNILYCLKNEVPEWDRKDSPFLEFRDSSGKEILSWVDYPSSLEEEGELIKNIKEELIENIRARREQVSEQIPVSNEFQPPKPPSSGKGSVQFRRDSEFSTTQYIPTGAAKNIKTYKEGDKENDVDDEHPLKKIEFPSHHIPVEHFSSNSKGMLKPLFSLPFQNHPSLYYAYLVFVFSDLDATDEVKLEKLIEMLREFRNEYKDFNYELLNTGNSILMVNINDEKDREVNKMLGFTDDSNLLGIALMELRNEIPTEFRQMFGIQDFLSRVRFTHLNKEYVGIMDAISSLFPNNKEIDEGILKGILFIIAKQNESFSKMLLSTGNKSLDANYDRWGENLALQLGTGKGKGKNLLGKALTEVRDKLRAVKEGDQKSSFEEPDF